MQPSKMHNLFTIAILILFFFSKSSTAYGRGTGWKPIPDVTDPLVVDVGKFAVDEHNRQDHASLKFGRVVKGERQLTNGVIYNLTITAADGSADKTYVAIVGVKLWGGSRQLVSFEGPVV